MGLLDIFNSGNSADPNAAPQPQQANGDQLAAYLGNMIDPSSAQQFQNAWQQRGLMGLATGLLQNSGPSRMPVTFGNALGGGLSGLMGAENAIPGMALQSAQTANTIGEAQLHKIQGAQAVQNMQFMQQLYKELSTPEGNQPLSTTSLTGTQLSPNASNVNVGDFGNMVKQYESGNKYFVGTGENDLSNAPQDKWGFPQWEGYRGKSGMDPVSHAAGAYQIQPALWHQYADKYFNGYANWRDPAVQDQMFNYIYQDQGGSPWLPFNPKLAAAVSARQSFGLPMAPPSMNGGQSAAGSDTSQQQPSTGQPASGGTPTAQPGTSGAMPYNLPMSPEKAQRVSLLAGLAGTKLPDYISGVASLPVDYAKAWASVQPELYKTWNSPQMGRPGAQVLVGGKPIYSVPTLQEVYDPSTGNYRFQYMTPPMSGGGGMPQAMPSAPAAPATPSGAPASAAPAAAASSGTPILPMPGNVASPPVPYATAPTSGMGTGLRNQLGLPPLGAPPATAGAPLTPTTGNAPLPGSVPAVAPSAPAAGFVAKPGPGTTVNLETRAKLEQEQRQKVIEEANAANDSNATLSAMQNEVGNFQTGPFADHVQAMARYLRLIDPSFNDQVSSYEDFVKNAGALTRKAVRDTSPRAAVQEFNMVQSSLPNPEMSPQGLQRVQNELVGLNKYKLFKSQAQDQWEQAHGGIGNVSGFETSFQKQVSPYAFVVANMSSPDRQAFVQKMNATKEGQQQLGVIAQQMKYINSSGLYQ